MIISKSPAGKYVLGIDFTDEYCQISYIYNKRARYGRGFVNASTGGVMREPVTYSMVQGKEEYNIPSVLCRLEGSSSWLAGREALDAVKAGKGEAVEGLLQKARDDVPILLGEEEYSAGALLSLYLSMVMGFLEPEIAPEQIAAVVFTSPQMDYLTEQALLRAFLRIERGGQQVFCESHLESFYRYMLMQDAEQRRAGMLLCEYGQDGTLSLSTLLYNRRANPVVFWAEGLERKLEPGLAGPARDREFGAAVQEALREADVSAAYLTGRGFDGGWLRDSAAFLCRGRRVFMGENLYSKGAAYSALFSVDRPPEIPDSIFLSKDALRSNIGIEVLLREQMGYHVLLDAGTRWYNAEVEEDFILESGSEFTLIQTPVTGGEARELTVRLEGLPERPERTTRVRACLSMPQAGRLRVQVRDLGFGDIFPTAGGIWEETFEV